MYSMSCRRPGSTTRDAGGTTSTTPTTKIPTSPYPRRTTPPRQAQLQNTPYPYGRYPRRTTPRYDTETDHDPVIIMAIAGPVLLCVFAVVAACFIKSVKRRKTKHQHAGKPQWKGWPGRAMHEPDFAFSRYEPPISHAKFDVKSLTGARPVRPPSYRETPDISTLSYPKPDPPPSYRTTRSTSTSRAARSDRPPPSYRTTPSISSRSRLARSDPPPSYRTTPATPSQR